MNTVTVRDVGEQSALLTIEESCKTLRLSRPTLRELILGGEVRPVHFGRAIRIPRTEIDALIARRVMEGKT